MSFSGIKASEKTMLVIGCAVLGLFALRTANAARLQEIKEKHRAM